MPTNTQSSSPVDTLIDVGGYRLHFCVYPGTKPAILIEAGAGSTAKSWEFPAQALACNTGATIITYDRAGIGESDLPDTPYDIRQEVAGLWRGLEQLNLANSLILLGHSLGGMLILVAACEHPDAVRALVFVDPLTIEFSDAVGGADYHKNHPLPFDRTQPEKLSKGQREMLRVLDGMDGILAVMRTLSIPPHIPVRVITAGIPSCQTPEENRANRESHEHLAASVKDGKLLVAERSGHFIQYDQPDIIVAALEEFAPPLRKEITPQPAILDTYVGEYAFWPQFSITVTREGGWLFAQGTDQPKLQMFAETENSFFLKAVCARVEFVKNSRGEVDTMVHHQHDRDRIAKKRP